MRPYRLAILVLLVLVVNPAVGQRRRSGEEYLVKPGDTGYGICQKHGLSLSELSRLNPGVDIGGLKAGTNVRISGTPEPAEPSRTTRSMERKRTIEPEVTVQPDAVEAEQPVSRERSRASVKSDEPAAASTKSASTAENKPDEPDKARPAKAKSDGYLSNYYNEPAKPAKKSEPSVAASLMRVVGALVFVVALAVLSLYALKHFTSSKASRKSPRRSIKIIETAGLGPNRSLHVVQAGNKFLLVGSTANQISLISELNTSEADEAGSDEGDFATILHTSSSDQDRADGASKLSDALRDGASFLQKKTSATRSMRAKAGMDEN